MKPSRKPSRPGLRAQRRRQFSRRMATESLEVRALLSAISGVVFQDHNGSSVAEAGDDPVSGATVYLDANNNAVLDDGEQSVVSGAQGEYQFQDLADGDYVVRQVVGKLEKQTAPGTIIGTGYNEPRGVGTRTYLFEMNPANGDFELIGDRHAERVAEVIVTNDGEIFGLQFKNNTFYSIDPATGEQTTIGVSNGNIGGGMAYDPQTDTIYTLSKVGESQTYLAVVDRTNGFVTTLGEGTTRFANSAMTFDVTTQSIFAYDNSGDGFYEFQLDGSATRLSETQESLHSWSLELVGDEFWMMELGGDERQILAVDPSTGTWDNAFETAEYLRIESLEFTNVFESPHRLTIANGTGVSGADFGLQGLVVAPPGFEVSPGLESLRLVEGGASQVVEVALSAQPEQAVVIMVSSSDITEVSASTAELVFTPENWSVLQPVTITGVDDSDIDGNSSSTVTFSIDDAQSDEAFHSVDDQAIEAVTVDDDVKIVGLTVSQSGAATVVVEDGVTDSVFVVLDGAPDDDVVVTVDVGENPHVTLDTASLTFTAENWDTPQSVVVTAIDNEIVDGSKSTVLTLAVQSSDADYDQLPDQQLTAIIHDNDHAGLVIEQPDAATGVDESGTFDTFTVSLTGKPQSPVVIQLTGDDPTEFQLNLTELVFSPENWDIPRIVTVTGVNDDIDDGDVTTDLQVTVDTARSDSLFNILPDEVVEVTTFNDETAGFLVTQTDGGTEVGESTDSQDELQVVLTSQPASSVVIDVVADDLTAVTADATSVTFTPDNWNVSQTVTLSGVADGVTDGDLVTDVRFAVNANESDDQFDGLAESVIGVSSLDDEVAEFTVSETAVQVAEDGMVQVTVTLAAEPVTQVALVLTVSDTSQLTSTPTLVFNPTNWELPQAVFITGFDDRLVDGVYSGTLTVEVDDALSDAVYQDVGTTEVSVTVGDNDVAGINVVETDGATVIDELGMTDTVNITLTAQPAGPVVFDVRSLDESEVLVTSGQVAFDSTNWNVPQAVSLTGVADFNVDGDQSGSITLTVIPSVSTAEFHSVDPVSFSATNVDLDQPSLDPDADGNSRATSDGILFLRRMAGFTGATLTDGAVSPDGRRSSSAAIGSYIDSMNSGSLDIDGDGFARATSDGILILRYLAGFTGLTLTDGAISPIGSRRTPAEVIAHLDSVVGGGGSAAGPLPTWLPVSTRQPGFDSSVDGSVVSRYTMPASGGSVSLAMPVVGSSANAVAATASFMTQYGDPGSNPLSNENAYVELDGLFADLVRTSLEDGLE